ncbi:lysylphosphatidylglycerol synthase transmembrane domain-containing protein [Nocardioides insulae]|uniref:lysylphosphatidylglycerol synthase transmembrane domain-containing protein n=1 Tax=Nocardioides insulae TaxID=394734 RepID=UPI000402F3B4|nr:lysylphosphatidylglycerol synthase transmembrane domain-containing protein [Nocardioides insulae]
MGVKDSLRAFVRRWGWRTVGLVVTGVGLYVVMPSLLTMLGAWPQLARVEPRWFVVLALLETGSLAGLWWLTRIALSPGHGGEGEGDGVGWGSAATAQLAGNAASKVIPGGAAVGGVVQGRVLVTAGQKTGAVVSALTASNLLTTAVLLLLPVLTIPALIIGPPPARQLQLGLVVSLVIAVVIVAIGVIALTWPVAVAATGRVIGRAAHLVRRSWSADRVAEGLMAQRDRIAAAFAGQWYRAVFAAAVNRMFDYAALVAALVAFGAHARPAEVLLAYVVAQALAFVPITPGGLGFVDAGLTALLVVIGIPTDTAVIGTLLYRLFSFWLPIPVGVLAWAGWRIGSSRLRPPSTSSEP